MDKPEKPLADATLERGFISAASLPGLYTIERYLPLDPAGWEACYERPNGKGVAPAFPVLCWVLARSSYGPRELKVCGVDTRDGRTEICENRANFLGYARVEGGRRDVPREIAAEWYPEVFGVEREPP